MLCESTNFNDLLTLDDVENFFRINAKAFLSVKCECEELSGVGAHSFCKTSLVDRSLLKNTPSS